MFQRMLAAPVQVKYHPQHHFLWINDCLIPLTPKEYALCRTFLERQNIALQHAHELPAFLLSYLPASLLQQQAHIANRFLLQRHISNVNAKLLPFGLHISAFERNGYIFSWQRTAATAESDGNRHPSSVC